MSGMGETGTRASRSLILDRADALLHRKDAGVEDLAGAATEAEDCRDITLARKLWAKARAHPGYAGLSAPERLRYTQKQAHCTYRDPDLPAGDRMPGAIRILEEGDLLSPEVSQETLGLAGAIYKAQWRLSGVRDDLEDSLAHYLRGAEGPLEGDFGYTRINAAFVLDLLASQEEAQAHRPEQEVARPPSGTWVKREQAIRIRREIIERLPGLAKNRPEPQSGQGWWHLVTMAEAHFGVGDYTKAGEFLDRVMKLDPPSWQRESTVRQLATLASAQGTELGGGSEACRTLARLVGDSTQALHAIGAGKLGVALSGGGFRASLFHIGVLARLAELDLLRHVEVLSCVSGGSIIGARYYLEVRRLLEEKPDARVSREDYVDIVKRLERDFLAGVRKNLRTRLLAAWLPNLRTLLCAGYTRTKHLGELLEQHIYGPFRDSSGRGLRLSGLRIRPRGMEDGFNPKLDNWQRSAKVPILLLNATTLNTGHVWQFTVSWMGEPPPSSGSSVDANDLLRRMYYREAPEEHRQIRLGHAVAASACVPGVFDPLELERLYPKRNVRLIDGGVQDNQGIGGLLEQECTLILVSDASGQMSSAPVPDANLVPALLRSSAISGARIREAGFRELCTLFRSSALGGFVFLHLKKGLKIRRVNWVGCRDPYVDPYRPVAASDTGGVCPASGSTRPRTSYGVPKKIQRLLANLRTDLDSFTDLEAFALMLVGYRMAVVEFGGSPLRHPSDNAPAVRWDFLAVEPALSRNASDHKRLVRVLKAGGRSWPCRLVSIIVLEGLILCGFGLLGRAIWTWAAARGLLRPALVATGLGTLAVLVVVAAIRRKSLTMILSGLWLVTFGCIAFRLHLWLVEPLLQRRGAMKGRHAP